VQSETQAWEVELVHSQLLGYLHGADPAVSGFWVSLAASGFPVSLAASGFPVSLAASGFLTSLALSASARSRVPGSALGFTSGPCATSATWLSFRCTSTAEEEAA
jgi:hypothetical protein